MALRRFFGFSDGELMRSDAKPCSRLMRQTAGIFTVGGGLGFWVLCRLHYGPRITVPRSLRWAACGAVSVSSTTALLESIHTFAELPSRATTPPNKLRLKPTIVFPPTTTILLDLVKSSLP
ncbi:hypothetical protein TEA_028547 [Camellia sinensis var. sinensis]|uniref:DUF7875 domain-containing protein n=1 Tax=Camellia sinensis var. sinensis TaxID=542762 RepID=A0A4S4DGQ6_CAMSN|nr:hypothetical protein TEA_028547 [Camellia sinensis var. sinensis]